MTQRDWREQCLMLQAALRLAQDVQAKMLSDATDNGDVDRLQRIGRSIEQALNTAEPLEKPF